MIRFLSVPKILGAAALMSAAAALSSCSSLQPVASLPAHHEFRTTPGWEEETFVDEALLAVTTPENSSVVIILDEQRAVMLKDGKQIVLDTPVATGRAGHRTPTGSYTILQKKKDYASNLYGTIVDAQGNTVNSDADSRKDPVPAGGRFVGAPMPYWQRLTNTGIGMHVGHVPIGSPASHGCIRFPRATMPMLWERTKLGTAVSVVSSRDFGYPQPAGEEATAESSTESAQKRKKPTARPAGAERTVDEDQDSAAASTDRPRQRLFGFGRGTASEDAGEDAPEEGEGDATPRFRPE